MSDVKLKALRNHPFGTGIREKDEEYTATESEAAVLIALGWSEKAKDKPAKTEKVLKAEDDDKSKHHYKTRDMKAGK